MGLLIPTKGTRNILDTLNVNFDYSPTPTSGLQYLQSLAGTYPNLTSTGTIIYNRKWNPGDIAELFSLDPIDQSNGTLDQTHKKRWRFFLKSLSAAVFSRLQNALADAILNVDSGGNPLKDPGGNKVTFVRVTFDHVELEDPNDPDATKPNPNLVPSIVIFDSLLPNPSGGTPLGTVRHITLFTQRVQKNVP